jgi:glycosyltransferase involved in cell wall biosynthesis
MARTAAIGSDTVRVLFANNYNMALARAGWRAGSYPSHHLFGTARLGSPFQVVDLPYSSEDLAAAITRRARGRLGDVGQQLAALRMHAGSIVYGATARDLRGLAALRAAGLFRAPIVGVFQPFPMRGRLARWALRGFDRAIAMSRFTRQQLLAAGMPADRIVVLGWGADLSFPGFAPLAAAAPDARVVATGKTGRDLPTLLAALRDTGLPARLYGDRRQLHKTGRIPTEVEIVPAFDASRPPSSPLTYDHTVADLRSAAVVAIPLTDPSPLQGLTEVVDALACARPMIVTRAPYFDFDIEEIGCGWWVDRGDVHGWSERLRTAMSDRERLQEMGRAGHAWAGEHFNAQRFEDGVREVLSDVARSM